jgi:hypothetical protein
MTSIAAEILSTTFIFKPNIVYFSLSLMLDAAGFQKVAY